MSPPLCYGPRHALSNTGDHWCHDWGHEPPTLSRVNASRASFRAAIVVMAALAAAKLPDELLRLVWRPGYTAAIDLGM